MNELVLLLLFSLYMLSSTVFFTYHPNVERDTNILQRLFSSVLILPKKEQVQLVKLNQRILNDGDLCNKTSLSNQGVKLREVPIIQESSILITGHI